MNELFFFLSETMPVDVLVERIIRDLNEYRETQSEHTLKSAKVGMMMLLGKDSIKEAGSIDKAIDKADKMQRGYDLITPSKQ